MRIHSSGPLRPHGLGSSHMSVVLEVGISEVPNAELLLFGSQVPCSKSTSMAPPTQGRSNPSAALFQASNINSNNINSNINIINIRIINIHIININIIKLNIINLKITKIELSTFQTDLAMIN